MPLRILLAVLVALACPTSQAWATGPQFGPMSGGGSGVVANTCTAGDFFSAVDGSGNFTCSTPSGSGDVTAVGDCTGPACFEGTTGNSLQFEGATANGFETTFTAIDPTADRTISLPNLGGTVAIERVYDVRAYGALCNDSADDTDEIQAAIDAAEATGKGGVVELPVGICVVTGLNINEPGITLRGQGAGVSNNATVLSCNITTGTCVTIDSACTYGCGIENMVVTGRGGTITDLVLVDGTNAAADFIRNVTSSSQQYCVAIKNVDLIQDVSLFTPVAGASCRAVSVVDSAAYMERVKVNFSTNIEGGIVIEQTVSGQVDTVVLSDVEVAQSGGTGAGLKIMGTSATNPPRWIQVSNSLFEAKTTGATTGDYAIWLSNVRDFKCSSCYAQGGYNAVRVSGGPGPITFAASVIGNSMREALYHDADVVTTLVGTTVSDGGTETDNTYSDIYLSANSRGFTMIGGAVGAELLGFPGNDPKYGIEVDASASEYRFSDVNCSDVPDSGCASGLTPAAAQVAFTDGTAYADSDWSNYVLVRAPSLSANWTLTLPADDGNSGQFLQTDGSGTTTWATPSGSGNVSNTGTPADNQVAVWTDATTIEGTSGLTFSAGTLTATTFSGALSGNATTATTAGAGDSATSFFSSGELERTLLPAASADCSSSNWAKGIDADLVLDCSQPAFSDLSGSATDAQIPNNITVDLATLATTATTANAGDSATSFFSSGELERTLLPAASGDCSSNQFAKGVDADFVLDCAQPDHGGLAGLSDDDHTQYLALAGRTLSDPGGGVTTIATQTTSSPLAMTNSSGFKWLNWDADLTVPNISLSQIFSVNGSLDRTGTSDSLYQFTGFHMATEFTSSTANGPLFQDAFYDASVVNQVANTGTQNTYQPISFLSKPTFKASSGATLTIGQTTGVDINPSWGVAAGGTLTNTTFSAFKLHSPNEIGGTLSLPTYIALDVEDLDTAAVTTPLSLRSVGTTTEMRHAGPARFGATGAVTATYDLDVQGAANLDGDVRVGASQGAVSADDSIVTFPYNHDFSGDTTDMEILKINPTAHIGQASAWLGTYSGVSSRGMTIAHDDSTTAVGNLPLVQLFYANHVVDNSVAVASPSTFTFFDQAIVRGSGGVTVPSGGTQGHQSFRAAPNFSAINASTAFTQLAGVGLYWAPTVSTDNGADDGASVTVTTMTGVSIQDTANAGGAGTEAVTTQIGVDIAALSFGGTNIGIRNADTTVYTPTTQAITANSDTIQPAATTVCLTANSNYDLTSNPQIANGVEGQILYLWNCDSAADTIEINDTNGLQLTALFNMDAGDVIVLQYMTIAGASDWYEVSRTED